MTEPNLTIDPSRVRIERMLPLYQGIMCGLMDHRNADIVRSETAKKRQNQPSYLTAADKREAARSVVPLYWICEGQVASRTPDVVTWLAGFSNVTSPTNERTMIPSAIPKVAVAHSYPLFYAKNTAELLALLASFALDFCARQKVAGVNLTYSYVNQFAVPPPHVFRSRSISNCGSARTFDAFIRVRLLELTYTAWDMAPFAEDLGDVDDSRTVNPPFVWDDERRFWLRAELDAAFFHLYGIGRDDVDYIMDTFPIVRRKDEGTHGEYRTKRVIMERYDALQAAIDTGAPYASPLDPPPGHGPRHATQGQGLGY